MLTSRPTKRLPKKRALRWGCTALVALAVAVGMSGCARARSDGASGEASASATPPPFPTGKEPAGPKGGQPFIRDRAELTVDGIKEIWTLEWALAPSAVCVEQKELETCACDGVAFGEEGSLVLVRRRLGAPAEALPLDVLFGGRSRLLRWAMNEEEARDKKAPPLEQIVSRPVVPAMAFEDYDHDGRATEFLLEIGNVPCGRRGTVAVGIDRRNPRLHVFSSLEKPNEALVLSGKKAWGDVKAKSSVELVTVACGDHGSREEQRLAISSGEAGMHVREKTRPCK